MTLNARYDGGPHTDHHADPQARRAGPHHPDPHQHPGDQRAEIVEGICGSGFLGGENAGEQECSDKQGQLEGRPWSMVHPGPEALAFKQYARVEGSFEVPAEAVLKTVQARVFDDQGSLRANQAVTP